MISSLPDPLIRLMQSANVVEFATVSAAGVPIDTPLLCFPDEDLSVINVTTGLAYPVKAERARRNPKVGLLIEGTGDEPVISIRGMATVRDRDLQANTDRYLAETGLRRPGDAVPWAVAREAIWYWARIIVSVAPVAIEWWDNHAAMDGPPHRWSAPAEGQRRASDPAPAGAATKAPDWQPQDWHDAADAMLGQTRSGHLSLIDEQGFPLPFRAGDVERRGDCLEMAVPRGLPWPRTGQSSLSFFGAATFVGEAEIADGQARLKVERALPVLPFVREADELWRPTEKHKQQLMERLEAEAARRGAALPILPEVLPEPTAGARRRLAREQAQAGFG